MGFTVRPPRVKTSWKATERRPVSEAATPASTAIRAIGALVSLHFCEAFSYQSGRGKYILRNTRADPEDLHYSTPCNTCLSHHRPCPRFGHVQTVLFAKRTTGPDTSIAAAAVWEKISDPQPVSLPTRSYTSNGGAFSVLGVKGVK